MTTLTLEISDTLTQCETLTHDKLALLVEQQLADIASAVKVDPQPER